MKACFVGLGSIGKRHLKNFVDIMRADGIECEIHAVRSGRGSNSRELDYPLDKVFYSYEEMDAKYDMIFICNPTHLHFQSLEELCGRAKSFFIEKPLFETYNKDISTIKLSKDSNYYVACPLRYNAAMMAMKNILESESVLSARAICSSYLPDWRPGQDYTKTYSAHKEQGGGVRIDLIHEWDYLTDLFGIPKNVFSMSAKVSALNINSEDLAIYIAEYGDKLVELHLDYFGRRSQRTLEIFTNTDSWILDILNTKIYRNNELIFEQSEDSNEKYIREIRYFVDLHFNKTGNKNDIINAMSVMKLAEC